MSGKKKTDVWTCSNVGCVKVFKHKQSLNNHKKNCKHSNNNNSSKCTTCNKTFCRPSYLKAHVCKKKKTTVCSGCGVDFRKEFYLKRHLKSCKGNSNLLKCEKCSKEFKYKTVYVKHMTQCQQVDVNEMDNNVFLPSMAYDCDDDNESEEAGPSMVSNNGADDDEIESIMVFNDQPTVYVLDEDIDFTSNLNEVTEKESFPEKVRIYT